MKDPQILGRQLEYKVQNSMVTNPRCAGVSIVQGWYQPYDGGSYDKGAGAKYIAAKAGDYWALMFQYEPGSEKVAWWLMKHVRGSLDFRHIIDGDGTPAQIAENVCIAVTGQGAQIE